MSSLEAAKKLVYLVRGWQQRSPEFCTTKSAKWAEIIDRLAVQPAVKELEQKLNDSEEIGLQMAKQFEAASERAEKAEAELAHAQQTVELFSLVIQCSEPWSDSCQAAFDRMRADKKALSDYESNAPVPTVTSFLSSKTSNVATNAINAKVNAPVPTEANRLSDLLCPVHANLDIFGKLKPFDNCIACIRNERDELRTVPTEETGVRELFEGLRDANIYFMGLAAYLATCNTDVIVKDLETTIASLHAREAKSSALLSKYKGV